MSSPHDSPEHVELPEPLTEEVNGSHDVVEEQSEQQHKASNIIENPQLDLAPHADQTNQSIDLSTVEDIQSFIQQSTQPHLHEDNVDVDSLSSYLQVDRSSIESLSVPVLQKIQATITELTDVRSEKMTLEVKLENSTLMTNKKLELLRSKMNKAESQNGQLKETVASLEETNADLLRKTQELETVYKSSSSATESSQAKFEELSADNRRLMEIISKKNTDIADLKSDYNDLQEDNSKRRKTIVELQSTLQTTESQLLQAKNKCQSLETQLELEKKGHAWVSEQLEKTTSDFTTYRTEKSSEVSKLQSQIDQKSTDINSLELRYKNVSTRFDDVSKKLDDSLLQVKALKDEKSSDHEEYLKEISVKERLITLLQKSLDDAKSKIEHLEDRLDNSRNGVATEAATLQTTVDKYKAQLEHSEAKIKQLEETIDELTQSDPHNTGSSNLPPLSPSAKVIAGKHTGLSLSQLYADFTLIKRQLTQERRAKERMQQQLDGFVNELEQKAPIISATKERAQMLEKELTELSIILETTTREKESLQKSQDELTSRVQESQVEITALRKQRADLARQVQHLVVQVTVRTDDGGPLTPAEKKAIERIAQGDTVLNDSDTDRLISDRLVTFQNIVDLQKKNEDLLRIVRELGAKAEQQERLSKSRLENLESTAINEAKDAIVTLQDELKMVDDKLAAVTRERDMFRSLLAGKSDNNILPGDLSASGIPTNEKVASLSKELEESQNQLTISHEQLERVRVESETTINMLNKQINSLTAERSELSLKLARVNSTNELMTERFNSVQDNLKYTRSEIEEHRKNIQVLQTNLAKQEAKAHQAAEQLIVAKSEADTLRSENSNLKHEKEIWKSIEQRLTQESSSLNDEKNRLNTLLVNLQFADKEREARADESQKRWSDHTESIEKELANTRTRLSETSAELKDVLSRKDVDSRAYQDRIDSLRTELEAAKSELMTSKHNAVQLESKVESLTSKLSTVESRLQSFQTVANAGDSNAALSETMKLKDELDEAKANLEDAEKSAIEFKQIARDAEEALKSMTEAYDNYTADATKKITDLESEKSSLAEKVEILTEQVNGLTNELEEQKNVSKQTVANVETELQSLRAQVQETSKMKADYDAKVSLMESSFQEQLSVAQQAEQKFEDELQKHAAVTKAFTQLRDETNTVKEQIKQLATEAKQAKDELIQSQESWDTQKTQLEEELRVANARVHDLNSQNHILHNQLETLSKSTPQQSIPEGGATAANDAVSDELRELINLLRREKDLAESQLDNATRDLNRIRQQLNLANSELDKTRLELSKSQSRDSDVDRITQEYEKLQKDLEQLDLLRESNTTLRRDLKTNVAKVKLLQEQLSVAEAKVEPLVSEVAQLKTEAAHRAQEVRLITEEKDRWQKRSQDILSKYDRIDPEEHNKLQETVAELTKKIEESEQEHEKETTAIKATLNRLKTEAQEKLKKSSTNYKSLQARFEESAAKLDTTEKEAESFKKKSEELQEEVNALKQTIVELEGKANAATDEKDKEKKSKKDKLVDNLKKELETTRAELAEKTKELEKAKEAESKLFDAISERDSLSKKVESLETELTQARSLLDESKGLLATPVPIDEDEAKLIAELRSKLEKATAELEASKIEIEMAKSATVAPADALSPDSEGDQQLADVSSVSRAASAPPAAGATEDAVDVEAALAKQKKELRAEFDTELSAKIEEAKQDHIRKIRGATQEKLDSIAKRRTESLEEEHAKKIKELTESYEKKISDLTESYEKKVAEAKAAADESHNDEKITAEYEAKIAALKEEHAAALEKAVAAAKEQAMREANMRQKLLQGQVEKLRKAKDELTKKLATVESGSEVPAQSDTSAAASPVKPSLPAKPVFGEVQKEAPPAPASAASPAPASPRKKDLVTMNETATKEETETTSAPAAAASEQGLKRPAPEDVAHGEEGPQEKKTKSEA